MDDEIEIEPDLSVFPSVEVDVTIDEGTIQINCDDKNDGEVIFTSKNINDYKEEMLKDGLVESDVDYFIKNYKNLEEVKFIKTHCTGCDKHMGSAPKERDNRFQHPILKVLLCLSCYQFYCSGEFSKGEDGSELYCRWCGEGGLVYCCTKCPFVFCKNCITRNLGRGTARRIENTEHWVCFACNPLQIERHRATYWAIQKYSEEAIEKARLGGDVTKLDVDANICCQGKKRIEPLAKTRAPVGRKQKMVKNPFDAFDAVSILESSLKCNIPSTSSKGRKSQNNSLWQTLPMANTEPEDEVICTPDIIPIDESPPNSPLLSTPPPLIPYIIQQQSVSKIQPKSQLQPILSKGKIVPVQLKTLQKNTFQKQMYPPMNKIVTNRTTPINLGILQQQEGLRIIHHPVSQTINLEEPKSSENAELENDWFDKAIIECAEATEYISTKISSLAGVHSRAQNSEKLMQELHNTLQTYIHVAINKMRRIKRNLQSNFENEMNKSQKIINPFAKNAPKNAEDSSSQDTQSASDDDKVKTNDADTDSTANSIKAKKRKLKDNIVPTQTKIQRVAADEDVLFDMDVTNASDEEMESMTSSSVASEVHFQTEEVINITSSSDEDDDSDCEEVTMTNNKTTDEENTSEKEVSNKGEASNKEEVLNKEEVSNKEVEETSNKEVEETSNKEVEEASNKEEIKERADTLPQDQADEISAKENEEISNKEEIKDQDPAVTEELDKNTDTPNEEKIEEEKLETPIKEQNDDKITNSIEETPQTTDNNLLKELVEKVETKFNIKQITSNDLLNYLSPKVILYNNRRARKAFAKLATTETKVKQFNVIDTIQDLLNTEWKQVTKPAVTIKEKTPEPCDIEEILGGSAIRASKSFGDEFSRFIDKSSEGENCNIQSGDELSENEDISNNVENNDIKDDEKVSDDSELDEAELFFNKDNESLSLPPDGIGDTITANNIFATKEAENSDLVLDSGILALKQMAENCVNPTVELRQASTECNG